MTSAGVRVRTSSRSPALRGRDQIVQAAAATLLESGYEGATVRAVAARAGVALGNVQYYFPNKSELLLEAWRYLTDHSVAEFSAALDQLTDPVAALEHGIEGLWESMRRVGDMQLAAFDLLVQAPRWEPLKAFVPELFARYREVIEVQLDRLEAGGRVKLKLGRDVLVPLVLNTVLGFGLYYVVTGDERSCLRALSAFTQVAPALVEVR